MSTLFLAALLSSFPPSPTYPTDTDSRVDEIVALHLEARGGVEALRAIRSLVFSEGVYREAEFEGSGDAYMAFARPFYRVVGHPERPGGFREGYDGSAWEWYAEPGVVLRTVGAAAGAIRRGAVLDGPFVDYRERGTTIELIDDEAEVDGRAALHLRVTLRDGFATETFLDAETYLVVAGRSTAPVHAFGGAVPTESRFGDYRPVAGVLFAHHDVSVHAETGEVLSEMHWGRIEAGAELPREWFSPPQYERSPLQAFVEQVFAERDDELAVQWTYRDYRLHRSDLDLRRGVEFVGYHMLKAGAVRPAVALLSAHAADHPDRAAAHYELGRAWETAGKRDEARFAYEQALILDDSFASAEEALARLEE